MELKKKENTTIEFSTFKNLVFHSFMFIPVLFFFVPVIFIFSNEPLDYFLNSLLMLCVSFLLFVINGYDGYVKIIINPEKIVFYYPYKFFKKKVSISFSDIQKIDLSPPSAPRSKPSIEVFFKEHKKSKHFIHLFSNQQIKKIYSELSDKVSFQIIK